MIELYNLIQIASAPDSVFVLYIAYGLAGAAWIVFIIMIITLANYK